MFSGIRSILFGYTNSDSTNDSDNANESTNSTADAVNDNSQIEKTSLTSDATALFEQTLNVATTKFTEQLIVPPRPTIEQIQASRRQLLPSLNEQQEEKKKLEGIVSEGSVSQTSETSAGQNDDDEEEDDDSWELLDLVEKPSKESSTGSENESANPSKSSGILKSSEKDSTSTRDAVNGPRQKLKVSFETPDLVDYLTPSSSAANCVNDLSGVTEMGSSWFITPPPCFTGTTKSTDVKPKAQEAARENALIEHPLPVVPVRKETMSQRVIRVHEESLKSAAQKSQEESMARPGTSSSLKRPLPRRAAREGALIEHPQPATSMRKEGVIKRAIGVYEDSQSNNIGKSQGELGPRPSTSSGLVCPLPRRDVATTPFHARMCEIRDGFYRGFDKRSKNKDKRSRKDKRLKNRDKRPKNKDNCWNNKFIITDWGNDDQDDIDDFNDLFPDENKLPKKRMSPSKKRHQKGAVSSKSGPSLVSTAYDPPADSYDSDCSLASSTVVEITEDQSNDDLSITTDLSPSPTIPAALITSVNYPGVIADEQIWTRQRSGRSLGDRKPPTQVRPIEPERQPGWQLRRKRPRRRCIPSPVTVPRNGLSQRSRQVRSTSEGQQSPRGSSEQPCAGSLPPAVSPSSFIDRIGSSLFANLTNLTSGFSSSSDSAQSRSSIEDTERLALSNHVRLDNNSMTVNRRRMSKHNLARQNDCARIGNSNRRQDRRSKMHSTRNGVSFNRKVQTNFH